MRVTPADVDGSFLIELDTFVDARGSFTRIWDAEWISALGVDGPMVQTNLSTNERRGTTRGLHWQVSPYDEAKLVRCSRGALFDVAVDLRPHSPTYRRWQGVVLTAAEPRLVLVPAGCAHGYQTLEDRTEATYQVSMVYTPSAERGIRWDDPAVGIDWPIKEGVIVSDKDASWPDHHWENLA